MIPLLLVPWFVPLLFLARRASAQVPWTSFERSGLCVSLAAPALLLLGCGWGAVGAGYFLSPLSLGLFLAGARDARLDDEARDRAAERRRRRASTPSRREAAPARDAGASGR